MTRPPPDPTDTTEPSEARVVPLEIIVHNGRPWIAVDSIIEVLEDMIEHSLTGDAADFARTLSATFKPFSLYADPTPAEKPPPIDVRPCICGVLIATVPSFNGQPVTVEADSVDDGPWVPVSDANDGVQVVRHTDTMPPNVIRLREHACGQVPT